MGKARWRGEERGDKRKRKKRGKGREREGRDGKYWTLSPLQKFLRTTMIARSVQCTIPLIIVISE